MIRRFMMRFAESQIWMKNARIWGILRCEEDLLCKSIEVLGETAFAVSLRTSLHTILYFYSTCESGRQVERKAW